MRGIDWRSDRDSRSVMYSDRVLDPEHWITIVADSDYVASYDGQVALITAANLLGRMSPSIAFHFPSIKIVNSLPDAGRELTDFLSEKLYGADPFGRFTFRKPKDEDYVIYLGKTGASRVVHGSGWNAYCGDSPSPIRKDVSINPIGPALAVVLAVSQAFRCNLMKPPAKFQLNALNWKLCSIDPQVAPLSLSEDSLGNIWIVGTGSVGTAILYFLSLATRQFSGVLFDHDKVKSHNLDRSPIFAYKDTGHKKSIITQKYLSRLGVQMEAEPVSLDESRVWTSRAQGTPDIVVASANERNVRSLIESHFPPIQIYGTTGQNWQASVIRHIPFQDPCSLCLFPELDHEATECAAISMDVKQEKSVKVDAALPFLSFAAGIMAAAEIFKLQLPHYPLNANRVLIYTYIKPQTHTAPFTVRENCRCNLRSRDIHRKMIDATRYAKHSKLADRSH